MKLDADVTAVTKGDAKVGAKNIELSGDMKVAANGGGSEVELTKASAKVSGAQVGISGQGITEITGAMVKIN